MINELNGVLAGVVNCQFQFNNIKLSGVMAFFLCEYILLSSHNVSPCFAYFYVAVVVL